MSRKIEFYTDEYYHVFNLGTEKIPIFREKGDLYYFFDTMFISNKEYPIEDRNTGQRKQVKAEAKNKKQLVSIVAYCLLPNHFHLILRQKTDGGISKFMQKLGTSYTMYFNTKYKRTGVLFQGKFKAKNITGDFSLPLLSVYVNLNYRHHKIDPKKQLVKSSIFEYFGEEKGEYACKKQEIKNIITEIGGLEDYKIYAKRQSDFFKENKENKEKIKTLEE